MCSTSEKSMWVQFGVLIRHMEFILIDVLCVVLLLAMGTESMGESGLGMLSDVRIDGVPSLV